VEAAKFSRRLIGSIAIMHIQWIWFFLSRLDKCLQFYVHFVDFSEMVWKQFKEAHPIS